mgnify:CR=1 FL=1
MSTIYIKRNDTASVLQDQLLLDGVAINLTGATVSLCTKNNRTGASLKRSAAIVNALTGQVEYQLIAEDTATVGDHLVEWEIIFGNGRILTVPDNDWHIMKIVEDLG